MHQRKIWLHPEPRRRLWYLPGGGSVLLALGLVLAACGPGKASPPVPQAAGSSATTVPNTHALHLAGQCVRQHGIPNFADPFIASSGPATGKAVLDKQALVGVPSSVVSRALGACRTALDQAGISNGGASSTPTPQEMQNLIAFARCARNHGISNFPDPNAQGGFNLAGTGINSHQLSPAELAVAKTCLPSAHGAVHIPTQSADTNNGGQ